MIGKARTRRIRMASVAALMILVGACQADSIAGTYECRGPGDQGTGTLNLVWVWELRDGGALTITDPAETIFKGTWSAEGDSGVITVEGIDTRFSIDGDRLVSDTGECTPVAE